MGKAEKSLLPGGTEGRIGILLGRKLDLTCENGLDGGTIWKRHCRKIRESLIMKDLEKNVGKCKDSR